MNMLQFTFRNALRARARGVMTIVAVGCSLMVFLVVRAVGAGWTEQIAQTPNDRVVVRNKMGWGRSLPVRDTELIRGLDGVTLAMGGSWGGLFSARDPRARIEGIAVDPAPFVEMHDELALGPDEKIAFVNERRGALVSAELAEQFGWHVGDAITLGSRLAKRNIEFMVSGIFESLRHGFAQRSIYFHWTYHNDLLPEAQRDRINIVAARVADPSRAAAIARSVDHLFRDGDDPTFSQEDRATNAQLVGRFGAILTALNIVAFLILGVVMLILGNTMAIGVRERMKEYATLRALGFHPGQLAGFILGESALLGAVGAALCLIIGYPLINLGIGSMLGERLNFAAVEITASLASVTLFLGCCLGGAAAAVPAYRVARAEVTTALAQVE